MSESEGYDEVTTWTFEVRDRYWEVVGYEDAWVYVQEDTQGRGGDPVCFDAHLRGGGWVVEGEGYSELQHYKDGKTQLARDIEAFLNEHGAPCE